MQVLPRRTGVEFKINLELKKREREREKRSACDYLECLIKIELFADNDLNSFNSHSHTHSI